MTRSMYHEGSGHTGQHTKCGNCGCSIIKVFRHLVCHFKTHHYEVIIWKQDGDGRYGGIPLEYV